MSEPATFRFADIAGFTALTEAHGDAIMLRIPDPAEAIRFGLRIVHGDIAARRSSATATATTSAPRSTSRPASPRSQPPPLSRSTRSAAWQSARIERQAG